MVLIYGSCTPSGGLEPSCTPPVQIQIFPLCYHLDAVAYPLDSTSPPTIRGAPVGTQDGAPVLLTRRTQVKVYRGEGTDGRIGRRALAALRSLNTVAPVISDSGPILPPAPGVLEGDRACRDSRTAEARTREESFMALAARARIEPRDVYPRGRLATSARG